MKKVLLLLVVAAATLLSFALVGGKPEPASPQFLLGGIQVNEPDHDVWMEALKGHDMNTVSVTVYAKQGDWESDNLWFEAEEASVLREIRTAKKHGLNVVLILRVALDHAYTRNAFFWHGMIIPKSDELLQSWFTKYTAFVTKWGAIAQAEGVDILAVGSELNALSSTQPSTTIPDLYAYYLDSDKQAAYRKNVLQFRDRIGDRKLWSAGANTQDLEAYLDARAFAYRFWANQHGYGDQPEPLVQINARSAILHQLWKNLISRTREVFHGRLTYAANFDNYQDVAFWKELDLIGINAYFPLRDPDEALASGEDGLNQLTEGWEDVFEQIQEFQEAEEIQDLPILFTELGYTYRNRSTVEPWSAFGFSLLGNPPNAELIVWDEEPFSLEERQLAVRALHRATANTPDLPFAGLLYWKFSTDSSHYAIEPYLVRIGPDSDDPMIDELRRFVKRS